VQNIQAWGYQCQEFASQGGSSLDRLNFWSEDMFRPWAYTQWGMGISSWEGLAESWLVSTAVGAAPRAEVSPCQERAMSKQAKPSVISAHGIWADALSFSN
jgi:hypothetical protein